MRTRFLPYGLLALVGLFAGYGCSPTQGVTSTGTGAGSGSGGAGSGAGPSSSSSGDIITASTGSSGTGGSGECAAFAQQAENKVRPVDIIWAVDTSDSMVNELQQVEDNLNSFYQSIAGVDAHVVMIGKLGNPDDGSFFNPDPGFCIDPPLGGGGCPGNDNFSPPTNFLHVSSPVGSHSALDAFINNYGAYKPVLRQNAVKYFAVVTDDNAGTDPGTFTNSVNNLDPGWFDVWKFFGIFCTGGCGIPFACADTGDAYQVLVNQTGGVAGDLCANNQNFAPVFAAVAQTVNANKQLDCAWDIPAPPPGEVFQVGKVNVKYTPSGGGSAVDVGHVDTPADCGPSGGWYYDNNAVPKKILVCPATCSSLKGDLNGKVDILFGCDTVNVPK